MRVISGIRKGHRLKRPDTKDVRPTEDRVKESLFSILGTIDDQSLVLDLFAGSGAIGIEFLSRGASHCYFVDKSKISINIIRENLRHTKLNDRSTVLMKDSIGAIEFLDKKDITFSYVYIDPPFKDREILHNTLEKLWKSELIDESSLLIIEHEKQLSLEEQIFGFSKIDFRKYGSKHVSFFKKI